MYVGVFVRVGADDARVPIFTVIDPNTADQLFGLLLPVWDDVLMCCQLVMVVVCIFDLVLDAGVSKSMNRGCNCPMSR